MMLRISVPSFRLFWRGAGYTYSLNYPGFNQATKLPHLRCWSSQWNALVNDFVWWVKFSLFTSALLLGPKDIPCSGNERNGEENFHMALTGIEPMTCQPAFRWRTVTKSCHTVRVRTFRSIAKVDSTAPV